MTREAVEVGKIGELWRQIVGTAPPPLGDSFINKAVGVSSPSLVKEMYDIALRLSLAESGRQGALDAKASALLSTIGIAVTVITAVGFQVVTNEQYVKSLTSALDHSQRVAFVIAFVGAAGGALLASVFAVFALRLRDYEYVAPLAIFNSERTQSADKLEDDQAVTEYRRWLLPAMWRSVENDMAIHARKGFFVSCGHWSFIVFIASLLMIALLVGGQVFGKLA